MTYNDNDHSKSGFSSDKPGAAGQDKDGHRDGDNGAVELRIMLGGRNHDQELNGESEEKEEVKLQQGDVDLDTSQNEADQKRSAGLTWYVRYRRFMRRSALMCL